MIEKNILEKSTEISLVLPESGFSKDVLDAVAQICSKYESVSESYLSLKKVDDDVTLFFGFMLDDNGSDMAIGQMMEKITELFSGDLYLEGVCLNENKNLAEAMKSVTSPFYTRV